MNVQPALFNDYDPAKDGHDSYYAAIAAKRRRLAAIRCEEVIGDCRLILGDCLEVLPLIGKVDAVVTDPPYGIERFKRGGLRFDKNGKYANGLEWDNKPSVDLFKSLIDMSAQQIIWGANNFTLPVSEYFLVWDKQQTVDNFASAELAYTNIKVPAKIFRYSIHQHNQTEKDRRHPTQKPLPLMKWCLGFLPDARTILDPFMGSGSTGVACAMTGRSFIGIEMDKGYFDIACERIRRAYAQPDLFIAPSPQSPSVQLTLI